MRQNSWIALTVSAGILLGSWSITTEPKPVVPVLDRALALESVQVTSDRPFPGDSSTHYFTMTLPGSGSSGFTMLSFTEQYRDQGAPPIQFDVLEAEAFSGTPEAMGRPIPVASGWVDETGMFWIEFSQPVPPTTTLTVMFNVQNLPSRGMYEYGIAAYPVEANFSPVHVGNGTLTIAN